MAKNTDKIAEIHKKKHETERNYLYWMARLYVLVILAIFPLCVGYDGYDDIIHSKAVVFWGISIVFLIVFSMFYLVYWFGLGKMERPPRFWKTFSIPDWAALAFLVFITISCLLSPYKDIAFWGQTNRNDGWLTYFFMIMSYFVLSRWYKPKQLDFAIFSMSSILVYIIGVMQFHGNDFLKLFPHHANAYVDGNGNPIFSGYSISFRSTLGNVDFVSAYVCITIIIFGVLYVKGKGPLRFLHLAASVMNFDLMIMGGADAGKVGVLGAMVLLIPYWLTERKNLGRVLALTAAWGFTYVFHHWLMVYKIMPGWNDSSPIHDQHLKAGYSTLPLKAIFIISMIFLVAGLTLLLLRTNVWMKAKTARIAGLCFLVTMLLCGITVVEIVGQKLPDSNIIHQAREIMHGRMSDRFGSSRIFVWQRSLEQFSAGQPFFGTGPDTFIHAFGKSNQEEASATIGVVFDKAHNDFIQILLCNGILALASYLILIVGIVIISFNKAFDDDILLVALGGTTAYLIQSFFGIDTLTVTPIYWVMIAIVRQRQEVFRVTPFKTPS